MLCAAPYDPRVSRWRAIQTRGRSSLIGKRLRLILKFYATRPELARHTVEHELSRMEYALKGVGASPTGEANFDEPKAPQEAAAPGPAEGTAFRRDSDPEMRGPEAIRSFYWIMSEPQQQGMLWRLANPSLLSDVLVELRAAGYTDISLGAYIKLTEVKLLLDLGASLLRVTAALGVFITTSASGARFVEEPLQIARLVAHLEVRLPQFRSGLLSRHDTPTGAPRTESPATVVTLPAGSRHKGRLGRAGAADACPARGSMACLVRAAKIQPRTAHEQMVAAARLLCIRFEHANELDKPFCLRQLNQIRRAETLDAAAEVSARPYSATYDCEADCHFRSASVDVGDAAVPSGCEVDAYARMAAPASVESPPAASSGQDLHPRVHDKVGVSNIVSSRSRTERHALSATFRLAVGGRPDSSQFSIMPPVVFSRAVTDAETSVDMGAGVGPQPALRIAGLVGAGNDDNASNDGNAVPLGHSFPSASDLATGGVDALAQKAPTRLRGRSAQRTPAHSLLSSPTKCLRFIPASRSSPAPNEMQGAWCSSTRAEKGDRALDPGAAFGAVGLAVTRNLPLAPWRGVSRDLEQKRARERRLPTACTARGPTPQPTRRVAIAVPWPAGAGHADDRASAAVDRSSRSALGPPVRDRRIRHLACASVEAADTRALAAGSMDTLTEVFFGAAASALRQADHDTTPVRLNDEQFEAARCDFSATRASTPARFSAKSPPPPPPILPLSPSGCSSVQLVELRAVTPRAVCHCRRPRVSYAAPVPCSCRGALVVRQTRPRRCVFCSRPR